MEFTQTNDDFSISAASQLRRIFLLMVIPITPLMLLSSLLIISYKSKVSLALGSKKKIARMVFNVHRSLLVILWIPSNLRSRFQVKSQEIKNSRSVIANGLS